MAVRKKFLIRARDHRLSVDGRTLLMGIVNVTPDSFSGDGHVRGSAAVRQGLMMARAGADILDVGGESTRPGAKTIPVREEIRRVVPVIRDLVRKTGIPVSVDTCKAEVAEAALKAGASIVNVIQGTPVDLKILRAVKRHDAAIVLMHMRGTPRTMQTRTNYRDVLDEVVAALKKSVEKCFEIGIKKENIIVDPGICFAKTAGQNLLIIKHLSALKVLGCPVLVGPSRKSFIGKTLDLPVHKRVVPTAAAVAACILSGAQIIRVHDVVLMKQAAGLTDAILNASRDNI